MIREQEVDGKKAIVAFFDADFEACEEADAAIVKVIFEDGSNMFVSPEDLATQQEVDIDTEPVKP